jgi:hypothetical protein
MLMEFGFCTTMVHTAGGADSLTDSEVLQMPVNSGRIQTRRWMWQNKSKWQLPFPAAPKTDVLLDKVNIPCAKPLTCEKNLDDSPLRPHKRANTDRMAA